MSNPDPVERALRHVGHGTYRLGAGGWRPLEADVPWTGGGYADCVGFALWCHRIQRHRPGFNHGDWATVSDDINTDSIVEDALHHRELFALAADPAPGDLIVYRSIWQAPDGTINDEGRGRRRWIGHVGVIVGVPAVLLPGRWRDLQVVQCHAGTPPAVSLTSGGTWAHHEEMWTEGGVHPMRGAFVVCVVGK